MDENPHLRFHSEKMAGVLEAAQKHRVNLIRFTDGYVTDAMTQYEGQATMVLEQIKQCPLDGLVFLGWTQAAYNDISNFKKRFAAIPLLSVGTSYEGIPYVYFAGDRYFREILLHLINVHGLRRIAYIAPLRADNRNETYINTMQEYGFYDPKLYVSEKDNGDIILSDRGKGVVSLLLDERRVQPEAIMSVYNLETAAILNELKNRGINVPGDMAVTSYGDSDCARFASPALTTVYFPWFELGFYGLEKMVELLTRGHIPLSNEITGEIIYRNSCGCMSNAVKTAGNYGTIISAGTMESITYLQKQTIIREMEKVFPSSNFDFAMLLEAFQQDFKRCANRFFLAELGFQLKNADYGYKNYHIENLVSVFSKLVLPFVSDRGETLLWAGDLFLQA